MAISDTQKVDYLFKKVGYGVAKTDTSTVKSPSNESIASPLLIRGDSIWQESASIPSTIPSSNSSVVSVYSDALHSTVPTTNDATASTNRTWKTGLTDWIDSSFGSTYQVKVYVAPTGNSSPQTYGTQLFADGTGSDEWFFDYQSGVLNFIGTNLPSVSFTGNTVYVSGARYAGIKGISTISNINFSNTTISATGTNANLNINANGSGYVNTGNITATGLVLRSNSYISFGNSLLSNIANPINSQDAVTLSYLTSQLGLFGGTISSDNSSVSVIDSGSNGRVEITVDGFLIGNINSNTTSLYNTVNLGNLSINSETISSTGNIILNALGAGIVKILGSDAIGLPYGNIVARPLNPDVGYLRYNTDLYNIEFWDGSDWINSHQQVTSQNLSPNGLANSFSLTTSTTTTGVIVTINGVVQQPTLAYSVTGNVITFTETPISTDAIEVRTLATGVANVVATSMSGDNASVTFTSGNVEIVGNINVSKNAVIIGNVIANDFIYSNGVSILNALYSNAASQASNIADLYSNAASQASNIADLYSNAASQSGYINSANTAMKGYVDGQISTTNTSITTANTAMKGYVDAVTTAWQANAAVQAGDIATLYANAAVQSGAIVTANTAMKGYVDAVTTAWQANAAVQAGDIATLYANAAVQAGDIATLYANAGAQSGAIVTANTAMKGYVDAVTTAWQANAGAQVGNISYLQTNYANLATGTAQTFTSNITIPNLSVSGTTNSISYTTGALVVSGGLGVAKDVYIQGNLYVANIFNTYSDIITVEVPLLYLEAKGDELTYTPYNYDIGVYSHFWGGPANAYVHTGIVRDSNDNKWYFFSNVPEPGSGQVDIANVNAIYDSIVSGAHTVYGAVTGNANIAQNLGSTSAWWNNTYTNTLYAPSINGTLQTAAQTNITSLGNLTSLSASGTIQTTGIVYGNSGLSGTLLTAAQTNITSLGNLSSLSASGTIQTTGVVWGNSGIGGTLLTASQTNITSVGNLTSLSASGTIQTTGIVYGNSGLSGTLLTASQTNITSLGNLSSLSVGGTSSHWGAATFYNGITGTLLTASQTNITGVGTITTGTWSGSFGAVSGANLTSLTAGNLSGTIPGAVLGNSTLYVGTTAIALNRASASQSLTGISIDGSAVKLSIPDLRSTALTPSYFGQGVNAAFMSNTTDGLSDGGTYHGIIQIQQWTDATGGGAHELGFTDNNNIWHRASSGALTAWSTWYKLLDTGNYNSYAPTLTGTGASGSWGISVTGTSNNITAYTINQNVGTSNSPTFAGITVPSITHSGTSGVGDIGASGAAFGTVWAKATSAQYADLAENYTSDQNYKPGTVVIFGGSAEVTISTESHDPSVAGVVSTNPAYLMNSELEEGVSIALQGRVPTLVQGPVKKGDRVVTSNIPGVACRMDKSLYEPGCIIGKSLETIETDEIKTIEIVVGRL